jgi:murein DD-endopeptidase MepM/ murein hydrolase activator NlpD
MVSFYKHNATLLKRTGAFVRAGEAVAIIGNTGKMSSGPHLHFELWLQGKPVDPTNYIDF